MKKNCLFFPWSFREAMNKDSEEHFRQKDKATTFCYCSVAFVLPFDYWTEKDKLLYDVIVSNVTYFCGSGSGFSVAIESTCYSLVFHIWNRCPIRPVLSFFGTPLCLYASSSDIFQVWETLYVICRRRLS